MDDPLTTQEPCEGCEPAQVPLTVEEVAAVMTARGYPMSRGRVWQIEKEALRKIRSDPVLRTMAAELAERNA